MRSPWGGPQALGRSRRRCNGAGCQAWAAGQARHGALPGLTAEQVLDGVTCISSTLTVTAAHSDKELGRGGQFQGLRHHPSPGTALASRWPEVTRRGAPGRTPPLITCRPGDTIAALLLEHRRRLMVTADGAGASHGLYHPPGSAGRPALVPAQRLRRRELAAVSAPRSGSSRNRAWQIAIDQRGEVRDSACVSAPARTGAARMRGARGSRKRTSPS